MNGRKEGREGGKNGIQSFLPSVDFTCLGKENIYKCLRQHFPQHFLLNFTEKLLESVDDKSSSRVSLLF